MTPPDQQRYWFLEGFADEHKILRRIPIRPVPFQVGRQPDLQLPLTFANISRVHAEFVVDGDNLVVRDMGSRNGTFVNRERIAGPTVLRTGDVVHLGKAEFRIGTNERSSDSEFSDTMEFDGDLPSEFVMGTQEFLELLHNQSVFPVFQPLVQLADDVRFGFEVLGRGNLAGLPQMPIDLFKIALSLGHADRLSRLFRKKAIEAAALFSAPTYIFFNVHPSEMQSLETLMKSLEATRQENTELNLVLEIHEGLVTDLGAMRELKNTLRALRIGLAYDDFGAGQARLMELAEVPPDFLKFDRALVQDIDSCSRQRQDMIRMLVAFAHDVGARTLAEGIERREEAETCTQLGFQCAQGYYFGKPMLAAEFTKT